MEKGEPVITVDGVTYTYPGAETPAIKDIRFTIDYGAIFGLLGPSGAGKSTVQRILTKQIQRIDAGEVWLLGKRIGDWDRQIFERVGVVFELPNHYPKLTAKENLDLFASFYSNRTADPMTLLEMVGLRDAANMRVEAFSKGMQVRLNFARALLHDPEILFLDEPTTGLDPTTAAMMRQVIAQLKADGKTIILTTHNMHDADALCDKVGFLADGKMVLIDTPDALKLEYGERQVSLTVRDGDRAIDHSFPLDGLGQNQSFIDQLNAGVVETIHSQEASLDEVFQRVTGQSLSGATD